MRAVTLPSPLIEAQHQDKPWGSETIFADGSHGYVGKVIHVRQGHALSRQFHVAKTETMHVIAGVGVLEHGSVGDLDETPVAAGDTVHLPAGVVHRMIALTDLTFVEASTAAPGWRDDVVRLHDAYGREGTNAP